MYRLRHSMLTIVACWGLGAAILTQPAFPQEQKVVRAVLFFSPTCPHCHQVINEDLPVIFDIYGGTPQVWFDQAVAQQQRAAYYVTNGRLEVLLVDASTPDGGRLYVENTTRYHIPPPRTGVPRLVVGDSVLVGSLEIPQVFPNIIREALAGDGLDWPAIEGLESVIPSIPEAPVVVAQVDSTPPPQEQPSESLPPAPPAVERPAALDTTAGIEQPPSPDTALRVAQQPPRDTMRSAATDTLRPEIPSAASPDSGVAVAPATLGDIPVGRVSILDAFRSDPVGNSASVFVLVVMIASVLVVSRSAHRWHERSGLGVAVPLLAVMGVVVAGYLTYVETSGAVAVCGPVGDCNAVQQSPYAKLFGVVPVGLLGLLSYIMVIVGWFAARWAKQSLADWARLMLLAIAFIGTLFSIYLTFLEPFVIGATCMWCLTSSVVITLLLWLTAGPGSEAWTRVTSASQSPASETP